MSIIVKKKRVLYLVTESEWAGASRYVYDLATHLPKDQFEASVATSGRGDVLRELNERGIKTVYLKWLPRKIQPLKDFLAFWEILLLYFRERPDVIHLNSSKAGWLGSVAAAVYKAVRYLARLPRPRSARARPVISEGLCGARNDEAVRVVFTAHGWVFNEPTRSNWFFRRLERFASYFRDVIICVSESDRSEALHWRIVPPEKLVAIHNGIDPAALNFLDRDTARRNLANDELRITNYESRVQLIGTIANFYPNKGLEYLIEAISLLRKQPMIHNSRFEIRTIIIGDGPLRPQLEGLIKKHGLQDRVFLLGQIPEGWRYLKAFDCFVLPSIKEGLPYAVLEALAAGVPVVATAVGGIPEIREAGGSIRLVPTGGAAALADALLIRLLQPPTAVTLPKEFTLDTMLKKTFAVYNK